MIIKLPYLLERLARSVVVFSVILLQGTCSSIVQQRFEQPLELNEISISEVHAAVFAGQLTFRELVKAYLDRVGVYDQSSGLNAIVLVNPDAMVEAESLDREFIRTGKFRPLHGIPLIIKDNYQTRDLQTTAGSLAMKGFIPAEDAFQIQKLRAAGAIILAKANMAEWAFSPYITESSITGVTCNPYDLSRVPAGSSGGTAAAVASNFAVAGLGTDTGNSIRGPASHNALVGIRSSIGLTSRRGIVPLNIHHDIGGPMARTVEDAVKLLDVIAAYDPDDPVTKICGLERPDNYQQFLRKEGLQGARLGVFRHYLRTEASDPQIIHLMEQALQDLKAAGAVIIDPVTIPHYGLLTQDLWCNRFRYDLDRYLKGLGAVAPYRDLSAIVAAGHYAAYIENDLMEALNENKPEALCGSVYERSENVEFRKVLMDVMQTQALDAIIYPTWSYPPRKIGDLDSPAGDNSQYLSPHTGFPAITVPMGFTDGDLPAGISFVGRLCGEGPLIQIAYAYEQATLHRRPPKIFPSVQLPEGFFKETPVKYKNKKHCLVCY